MVADTPATAPASPGFSPRLSCSQNTGILDRITPVGAHAPDFELANHDGRRVSSAELLAGGPIVLSFFRGSW